MPRSGALWGMVRGRFGLYNYVMTAVSAVPSTGLGLAVVTSDSFITTTTLERHFLESGVSLLLRLLLARKSLFRKLHFFNIFDLKKNN